MNPNELNKQSEIEAKIDAMQQSMDKIVRGIYGDPENDQPGMIQRMNKLETFMKTIENAKWYVLGAFGIVAAVAGLLEFFLSIFTKIKGN